MKIIHKHVDSNRPKKINNILMKPDRSNYEIWFIDWLDGNLSDQQVEQLIVFLDENPDLMEEFDSLTQLILKPDKNIFTPKEHLKKSIDDLSSSQFDNLCIAYLENDLTPNQLSELEVNIDHDNQKKRAFELIQKLKLSSPIDKFSNKHILKKMTPGQRIIRLSAVGLSAAATIALFILAYLFIPINLTDKTIQTAQNLNIDTILVESPAAIVKIDISKREDPVSSKSGLENVPLENAESAPGIMLAELESADQPDSTLNKRDFDGINISKISVSANIRLAEGTPDNILMAYKPGILPPLYDDERSNVNRFIARFFHEKIMKDKTLGDRPVKAYEIAEVGITGLNKLLGWQMALYKNTDEKGDLKSVYFSSKILKFNAPVKKVNPAL